MLYRPTLRQVIFFWIAAAMILFCIVTVRGDEPTVRTRAKVAFALSQVSTAPIKASCTCEFTGVCTCPQGTCDCPACGASHAYQTQWDLATATKKPLIVWVGWTCPACIKHIKSMSLDVVHATVPKNKFPGYISEGVMIGYPRDGEMFFVAEMPPGTTGHQIASKLQEYARWHTTKKAVVAPVPFVQRPAGMQVFTPATTALGVAPRNTGFLGTGRMAPMFINAPGVAFRGSINCGPRG